MMNPLIRKLEQRDALSADEKRVLDEVVGRVEEFGADEDIVREGDRPTDSALLLDGWACRYKLTADGRRRIVALQIPGDFVDLHSFPLKRMDHSIGTLTPCKIALVPHAVMREITENHPHLTRLLWLTTLIDAAILREWLNGAGRRSALGDLAHLLCELFVRLRVIGQTRGNTFRLPITQVELSDVLGISHVHANRVVQDLRSNGVITWRGEIMTIDDWERLCAIAEFDSSYLHLEHEPR